MNNLEFAKKKLDLLVEKQDALLLGIKDEYDLDNQEYEDVGSVQDAIYQRDITLEWDEKRDVDYADDAVRCQQMLVSALELLEIGDKKSSHNANKAFETLVHQARKVRKDKEDDIRKAQEMISLMNEIIEVCDKHRK